MSKNRILVLSLLTVLLTGCAGVVAIEPTATASPSYTETATETPTPSATATATATKTPTLTFTASETATTTLSPTPDGLYAVLRPDMLSCRFGPGGA